jgi:hypothetical protein
VVIDPVTAYLDQIDSHKNAEVRGVLAPLRSLAEKYDLAVLLVTHLNKDASVRALAAVSGPLAFLAAARAVYLVTEDPQAKARRLILPLKSNLSLAPSGLAYTVESATVTSEAGPIDTALLVWDDSGTEFSAQEVLAAIHKGRPLVDNEKQVIGLLASEARPLQPQEIAQKLGWTPQKTRQVLHRMKEQKMIRKSADGYGLK